MINPANRLRELFDQYNAQFPDGTSASLLTTTNGQTFSWQITAAYKGRTLRTATYIINLTAVVPADKQIHLDAVRALAALNGALYEQLDT